MARCIPCCISERVKQGAICVEPTKHIYILYGPTRRLPVGKVFLHWLKALTIFTLRQDAMCHTASVVVPGVSPAQVPSIEVRMYVTRATPRISPPSRHAPRLQLHPTRYAYEIRGTFAYFCHNLRRVGGRKLPPRSTRKMGILLGENCTAVVS